MCDARAARLEARFFDDYISAAEARLAELQAERDGVGTVDAVDSDIRHWKEHLASLLLNQAELNNEAESRQAVATGMEQAR